MSFVPKVMGVEVPQACEVLCAAAEDLVWDAPESVQVAVRDFALQHLRGSSRGVGVHEERALRLAVFAIGHLTAWCGVRRLWPHQQLYASIENLRTPYLRKRARAICVINERWLRVLGDVPRSAAFNAMFAVDLLERQAWTDVAIASTRLIGRIGQQHAFIRELARLATAPTTTTAP